MASFSEYENVLLEILPQAYKEDAEMREITDSLTRGIVSTISRYQLLISSFEADYLDPRTAKIEFLDAIAYYVGFSNFWDVSWNESIKRQLLINVRYIFENRGNREVLSFLFSIFGLDARLVSTGGFILNKTLFPGSLLADPFSFFVLIPDTYAENSTEYQLTKKITDYFTPCWVELILTSDPSVLENL